MYTTLDHIIAQHKSQKAIKTSHKGFLWLSELKVLIILIVMSVVAVFAFTNAKLISALVVGQVQAIQGFQSANADLSLSSNIEQVELLKQEIQDTIQQYQGQLPNNQIAPLLQDQLNSQLPNYHINFNILPPVSRLLIPSIGLDVPLVDVTSKYEGDFVRGDFDTELTQGVVKYPTTPEPGLDGNTLFFGHTSQEWREHNPYGTVFVHLPKLQAGDEIQVVWEGILYKYIVQEIMIRRPKEVDKEFQKRQQMDGEYITLMGCYPLGTTKQRMMVIAKRVE